MLTFGITLKPDMTPQRIVALTRQAEDAGFAYGWLFDSHVLWLEPYPLLTLMALDTKRMRLGTCVTNPAVRDPTVTASVLATLNLISGGRMDLGIGRGDSSRRVLGKKPTTLADLEAATKAIRALAAGEPVEYEGEQMQLHLGARHAASVDRGLRPEGAATGRTHRRRRDPPIRRPAPDQVVHRLRARGRARGGTRPDEHQDHGGGAGLGLRRPRGGARACALVSRARLEPRDGPDRALRPGRVAAGADRATCATARATTTITTPRSAATTHEFVVGRGRGPLLHRRPGRGAPAPAARTGRCSA